MSHTAQCLAADGEQKEKRQQSSDECGTLFYHLQVGRKMISLFVYIYICNILYHDNVLLNHWSCGLWALNPRLMRSGSHPEHHLLGLDTQGQSRLVCLAFFSELTGAEQTQSNCLQAVAC